MKTASFENSVSVLVNAYMNDTLQHGKCHACAVGNIMRSVGLPIPDDECSIEEFAKSCAVWKWAFCTYVEDGYQTIRCPGDDFNTAVEAIEKTGYTWQQLAKVEFAFESAGYSGDRMFNGLMAVVSVLAEIHGIDIETTEKAKKLFVKA